MEYSADVNLGGGSKRDDDVSFMRGGDETGGRVTKVEEVAEAEGDVILWSE